MKKIIIVLFSMIAAWAVTAGAQTAAAPAATTTASADNTISVWNGAVTINKDYSKMDIQTKVLDNFDLVEEWAVNMPREQGLVQKKKVTAKAKIDDSQSQFCLGIKSISFLRGFNWIEVKPPQPIEIPGTAKALSILAFGENYRHRLIAWVKDWQGIEYRIDMGSLNFKGWQRMAVPIPPYVKQYSRYVPSYRPVKLTKFVIEFDPDEFSGNYYLYLDRFEVAVDVYKAPYDGDDMMDQYGIERWENTGLTSGAAGTGTQAPAPAKTGP
jgi:hypothetical protein